MYIMVNPNVDLCIDLQEKSISNNIIWNRKYVLYANGQNH